MPREVTTLVYKFDELSDKAKEKARDWFRETESELFGAHGELYEAAETAGSLLGVEFNRHDVPLMGGGKRSEPTIYWGLHVQGSGASFEGRWEPKADAVEKIKEEFPEDNKLHEVAEQLSLVTGVDHAKCDCHLARDVNSAWMNVTAYDAEGIDVESEAVKSALRSFADWIYRYIDDEYTYRTSVEQIDESILCNGYEFEPDGTRTRA